MNTIFESPVDLSIFKPYQTDCKKCCGLCCVALYFAKSDGFPDNKEAGMPCKNLLPDFKCKVHQALFRQGLKGCVAYDCFGAGQYVTSLLKKRPNWNALTKEESNPIFDSFITVLKMHQTLWYLSQCLILQLPSSEKQQAKVLIREGSGFIKSDIEHIAVTDTKSFFQNSGSFLRHICELYQAGGTGKTQTTNYMGQNMKGKNLEGRNFSMSLLIAANLEQANLNKVNFLGADMRDTNIKNTDLSQCLFLTQPQINGAKGNKNTILPPYLFRPQAWDFN